MKYAALEPTFCEGQMWSLLSKLLELGIRRSRLRVTAHWIFNEEDPSSAFGDRRLQVLVVNPVGHAIPIEKALLEHEDARWNLNAYLQGDCAPPPCSIEARDRCTFSISAERIATLLLESQIEGLADFRIEIAQSTGQRYHSERRMIDLELYRLWLSLIRFVSSPSGPCNHDSLLCTLLRACALPGRNPHPRKSVLS